MNLIEGEYSIFNQMKKSLLIIAFLFAAIVVNCQQTKDSLKIIAAGAVVQKAGSNFGFTEGASVAKDGSVYFTDQPNDKIYRWNEKAGITLFLEKSERSNGTYFDKKGNLIACADLNNRLVKFTPDGKTVDLWSKGWDGKHLNGPNDVWPDNKGGIYFTDPYFFRDYWEAGHTEVQDTRAVYYLNPKGELIRVISDYKQPNGIVGTPDGKLLYATDQGNRTIWRYNIAADGTLANKTSFAPSGSDGMTIDNKGNIYLTGRSVLVFDKNGKKIADIQVPEIPANICFGGKDRKTLFITARTSVYTLRMNVKGVE